MAKHSIQYHSPLKMVGKRGDSGLVCDNVIHIKPNFPLTATRNYGGKGFKETTTRGMAE
jgi:hypothetical protein